MAAFAYSRDRQLNALAVTLGTTFDFGAQIDDQFAVYLHGEFGSVLAFNHAAAYLVAEWGPVRWFSLGTGFGGDALAMFLPAFIGGSWSGLSVPLLVGFNLGSGGSDGGERRFVRIGLEGAAGLSPAFHTFGWHAGLNVGLAVM